MEIYLIKKQTLSNFFSMPFLKLSFSSIKKNIRSLSLAETIDHKNQTILYSNDVKTFDYIMKQLFL